MADLYRCSNLLRGCNYMTTIYELKPCPFCGETPKQPVKDGGSDERYGYNFSVSIRCKCGISVNRSSKKDANGWCCDNGEAIDLAVAAWNSRVGDKE